MISTIWRGLGDLVRDMGWNDAAQYIFARSLNRLSYGRIDLRKYYFCSQPIPDKSLLPARRGASIVVKQVDRSHPMVSVFPRPAQVITRRFNDGALCFLATKEEKFVGFLWLQQNGYLEDEVRCRFTPAPAGQTIWDFDVHLETEYRASFAFARLWDTANDYLRNTGIKWSVSRISAFNPASINSHVRLGAFPIASAYFFSGRRWQILVTGNRPYIHGSTGDHNIPELPLSADPRNRKRYRRFLEK